MADTKLLGVTLLCGMALAVAPAAAKAPDPAVGPQYDTAHVYVAPADVDRFVQSFTATFGGQSTKQITVTVTPTPSTTSSQLVQTPVGTVSVFGFTTGIPYPFGAERTGYLVRDMDAAVAAARRAGADVQVATFPDPIGRDAVVQWPGGVNMQLYWHNSAPGYAPLRTVPENRVYLSPDRIGPFLKAFLAFSGGMITSDERNAPGELIGRPGTSFRRVSLQSGFGKMLAMVTDGYLPYPYGRETTGYEVENLAATLGKATASGAVVLAPPVVTDGRSTAMVFFPGGYVAEVHAPAGR